MSAKEKRVGIRQWRILSAAAQSATGRIAMAEAYKAAGTSAESIDKAGVVFRLLDAGLITIDCRYTHEGYCGSCTLALTPAGESARADKNARRALQHA